MNKADTGIELRVTSEPLLDSRHSNQEKPASAAVEQVAQLLEARNFQPIGFVNQDQPQRAPVAGGELETGSGRSGDGSSATLRRSKPVHFQQGSCRAALPPRLGHYRRLFGAPRRFLAEAAKVCRDA